MSSTTKIFFTGATGYVGGPILWRLLQHPKASSFQITALVRSAEKAEKLKTKYGVNAVVGSLDDLELLEKLVYDADIVIENADSDYMDMTRAILKGTKSRYEATGIPPTLIHTSGTGLLTDNAAGMHSYDTIWLDDDSKMMASLPAEALHRNVDSLITEADGQGYVKTYIILPSLIWGVSAGPLVEDGISNNISVQIPDLLKASIDRGAPGMVGKGANIWPVVHIEDSADLYITLLDRILSGKPTDHGENGYYFGENGECSLYDVACAIGKALLELGKVTSATPTTFTQEELEKYFAGSAYLGSNSRCRGNHSRQIGWKPTKTTEEMYANMRAEAEALLAKYDGQPFTYTLASAIRRIIARAT